MSTVVSPKSKRGPYSSGAGEEAPTCFHERLRWLRRQRGLTQVEVAEALGCDQAMVSSWENGRTRPTAVTLDVLARFHALNAEVISSGRDFLSHAEAALARLRVETAPSATALSLTLEPPLPGQVALVDQASQQVDHGDPSAAVSQLLRALKKGRDVWVVMR
jgi:transcriptional regulator with XRE-family HTH domain